MNEISKDFVSIIIPTRNSANFLERCLKSIKNQTYKNIEIIVVDRDSSDSSKEIAKRYTNKVFNYGPERSAQVNYGARRASGGYVYKVDSDFVLDERVVQQCVEEANKGFDAIVVHNSPDVTVSWIAKIRKFEVDMYKYDLTHSSARFVKKSVYQKIGGFNDKITAGEDYDFQNKLNRAGYKTGFIEAEALHLGEPKSFWKHILKYYEYGRDFVNYREENKEESKQQLSFFRNVYFKNWKRFIAHPVLGTSFIFYNFFKFGFGVAGYLLGKVENKIKKPTKILAERKIEINEYKLEASPLVSIIVPTRNRVDTLVKCLKSIKNQTYNKVETVIVDQESEDNTLEVAKRFGATIKIVPKSRFYTPPSKSRNIGAKISKGEILYHLDNDMYLGRGLIKEMVEKFRENKDLGALVVHEEDIPKGFWSRAKAFERRCYWGNDKVESARVVRKVIFDKVGGYDEKISSGEDFDIHRRYKGITKIGFCKNVVHHDVGYMNFWKLVKRKFNYGKTAGLYFEKYSETGGSLLKEELGCYLKNYKLFLKNPLVGLASVFLKLVEFGFGGVGYIFAKF